jgi:hypothetical protein
MPDRRAQTWICFLSLRQSNLKRLYGNFLVRKTNTRSASGSTLPSFQGLSSDRPCPACHKQSVRISLEIRCNPFRSSGKPERVPTKLPPLLIFTYVRRTRIRWHRSQGCYCTTPSRCPRLAIPSGTLVCMSPLAWLAGTGQRRHMGFCLMPLHTFPPTCPLHQECKTIKAIQHRSLFVHSRCNCFPFL